MEEFYQGEGLQGGQADGPVNRHDEYGEMPAPVRPLVPEENYTAPAFASDDRALRRSRQLDPGWRAELDFIRSEVAEMDVREFYGDWDFRGYFPPECKAQPKCHIQKMTLLNLPEENSPDQDWKPMEISARKAGEGCSELEREHRSYGRVFVRDSQIFYSGQ